MSFFRRKGPYDIDHPGLDRRSSRSADGSARRQSDAPMSREGKKLTLLLILNTLLAIVIYFGCVELGFGAIFFVYIGLAAVLLLTYFIYNRGFVMRGVTPEMLPDSLTLPEKQAKIDEAARRVRDSRWMLTLLLPLVIALLFDVVYLFLLKDLIEMLRAQL